MIVQSIHFTFTAAATAGANEYRLSDGVSVQAQMEKVAHHAHVLAHQMVKQHFPDYEV